MTSGRRVEQGAVTAELAVALPSLVLVLAVALGAVGLGVAQVRCVDAARLGARLLARGEPTADALHEVARAAPTGARVSVVEGDGRVTVTVTGDVPVVLGALGGLERPSASATARVEAAP